MEGIILVVLIQYVVEYRFEGASSKSLLKVLNGSFHGEFYADSVSIRKSNLKMQNVEKTKFHKHIKPVKLSRQTLFFRVGGYI